MSAEAAPEISFDVYVYDGSEPSPEERRKQFALIAGGAALHQTAEAAAPEGQPLVEDKNLPFRGHAGSCYCTECQRHGFAPNDYSSFRNHGMFSMPGLWG